MSGSGETRSGETRSGGQASKCVRQAQPDLTRRARQVVAGEHLGWGYGATGERANPLPQVLLLQEWCGGILHQTIELVCQFWTRTPSGETRRT